MHGFEEGKGGWKRRHEETMGLIYRGKQESSDSQGGEGAGIPKDGSFLGATPYRVRTLP